MPNLPDLDITEVDVCHWHTLDLCPEDESNRLHNLVAFNFDSKAFEKPDFSSTDRKPWNVLTGHTLHALKCFSNDDADAMSFMIWLCTEGDPGEADEKNWAKAITRAVNE